MTLIVAVPTQKGLIMASDCQLTLARAKTRAKKINKLNDRCLWGGSGDVTLIQMLGMEIAKNKDIGTDRPLDDIRDELSNAFLASIKRIPPAPQPYHADLIFAEYSTSSRILYMLSNGATIMLEDVPFAIGIGDDFAFALLEKYQELIPTKIDNQHGAVLCYSIIAQTIDVIAGGVGYPIDVWEIPKARNFSYAELERLKDSCDLLRQAEIDMFLDAATKVETGEANDYKAG